MAKDHKNYNSDGKSSEDRALDRFTDMLIEKIQTLQGEWKKPGFLRIVRNGLRISAVVSTMA